MKVKLLKNYNRAVAGDILDLNKPIADLLLARKIAEIVKIKVEKVKKCSITK